MSSNKKNIEFRIRDLSLVEVSLKTPENVLVENLDYKFQVGLQHTFDTTKNLLHVACTIEIVVDGFDSPIGSIKTTSGFEIKDLTNFLINDMTEVNLPEEVAVTFNSIAISTTRGIMFSEFKGTFLHAVILPVIDPKTLN